MNLWIYIVYYPVPATMYTSLPDDQIAHPGFALFVLMTGQQDQLNVARHFRSPSTFPLVHTSC